MRPGGPDPAAEDDLLGAVGKALGELGQLGVVEQPVREREDSLDPGLLGPGPDDLRPRLAAHQQVERVGEHRLARAGLAGDRVQALAEAQLGPLDQQQVLDPQLVAARTRSSDRVPTDSRLERAGASGSVQCASRPNFSRMRR